jgi:hypothetical protein
MSFVMLEAFFEIAANITKLPPTLQKSPPTPLLTQNRL